MMEVELRLFTKSENEILELISVNHVSQDHDNISFDVHSFFSTARNIITDSTQIIDNILQGIKFDVENIDEKPPKASFSSPLIWSSLINSPGCEIIKSEGSWDESGLESKALEILKTLSKFSWEAKAVLALEAFALEYYGQVGKLVAILKQVVPDVINPANLLIKRLKDAVAELNNLVKLTVQVIECICDELVKRSTTTNSRDPHDAPSMESAMKDIPVNVYWSIITIIACATQLTFLASDDQEKPQDLSQFVYKIKIILDTLNKRQLITRSQSEIEAKIQDVRIKHPLSQSIKRKPTSSSLTIPIAESKEVFKDLIFSKDNVQPILIDGSTNNPVDMDVLRWKNMFLFFSNLEISDADISALKQVYMETQKDDKYKIVWVPIVEQWTKEKQMQFEKLRSKMQWYTVQCYPPIAGIKLIEEEWHFKGKPMLVVMNSQGIVKNTDALPLIRKDGIKAFPFHKKGHDEKKDRRGCIFIK